MTAATNSTGPAPASRTGSWCHVAVSPILQARGLRCRKGGPGSHSSEEQVPGCEPLLWLERLQSGLRLWPYTGEEASGAGRLLGFCLRWCLTVSQPEAALTHTPPQPRPVPASSSAGPGGALAVVTDRKQIVFPSAAAPGRAGRAEAQLPTYNAHTVVGPGQVRGGPGHGAHCPWHSRLAGSPLTWLPPAGRTTPSPGSQRPSVPFPSWVLLCM